MRVLGVRFPPVTLYSGLMKYIAVVFLYALSVAISFAAIFVMAWIAHLGWNYVG